MDEYRYLHARFLFGSGLISLMFGFPLLVADQNHDLGPDNLLLLLAQLWAIIAHEHGHFQGLSKAVFAVEEFQLRVR
jgi:hypothetical protein